MHPFRYLFLALCIGSIPIGASADELSWIYNEFSSGGSYYNANNHNPPQGAGINTQGAPAPPAVQQQMYMPGTNIPFQSPQQQSYSHPQIYSNQQQQTLHLNPSITNPNNFVYMHPQPPPPVYHAPPPPPIYRAPVTGFGRR
jgi:hypothetical protein